MSMDTQSKSDTLPELYVALEFTPNPNTLKYSVNRELLKSRPGLSSVQFTQIEEAQISSPLAVKLLRIKGIASVMIGPHFVTITKSEDGDWDHVHKQASVTIETHLKNREPVVSEDLVETQKKLKSSHGSHPEIEAKIIEILDREVRPAVAMDGGDITFEKYEDGVVYVFLQGACAGCPSSTMTLKMGIESRLKEAIPEIKEVVSV